MDSQSTLSRGDTQNSLNMDTLSRGDTQNSLNMDTLSRGDTQNSLNMDVDPNPNSTDPVPVDLPQLIYQSYFKNDRSRDRSSETSEISSFLDWVSEAWRPSGEGMVDGTAVQQHLRVRLPALSWQDSGVHLLATVNEAWQGLGELNTAEARVARFLSSIDKSVNEMKVKIRKQPLQADVMQQKLGRCDTWATNKVEELKADLGPIRASATHALLGASLQLASLFEDFKSQETLPDQGMSCEADDIEMELSVQLDMMNLDDDASATVAACPESG